MKRRILVLLVIAAAAGGGYAAWHYTHQEEDQSNQLVLYGNVDIRELDLGFRVSGRVADMRFEEGDQVHKGDVVAVLDKAPYRHNLALARAQLASRRAVYAKMQAGTRPQEIAEARANVAQLQATLKNVTRIYQRQAKLVKKDVASKQAYEDALANRNETRARLASAKAALSLAEAGFRKEDIRAAAADVQAGEAQVALAETHLQDTEITAPADATVLTRAVEPGTVVAAGATVYTLSLASPVWVRTYVGEPDLGRVHPGMPARVETDGGRQYQGQIGFISPDAEFTPKTVQTTELRTDLVYRVRVIVQDPDNSLRRGMPVTVKLDTTAAAQ